MFSNLFVFHFEIQEKIGSALRPLRFRVQDAAASSAGAHLETKRIQSINSNIEKILVRFDRLQNEPRKFSPSVGTNPNYERDNEAEESRLKQLASSEGEQIGNLIIDLKSAGFEKVQELEEANNRFVAEYGHYVGWDRLWHQAFGHKELAESLTEVSSERDEAWRSMTEHYMNVLKIVREQPSWNPSREKTADTSSTASAGAGSATGTWKWVLTTEGGDSIDLSLKVKQDGEKLTGVVILGDNEVPISDGFVKDSEVTFKVTREQDGKTQVAKFKGKLDGDTIKGKIDSDWSGENRTYHWTAKRSS